MPLVDTTSSAAVTASKDKPLPAWPFWLGAGALGFLIWKWTSKMPDAGPRSTLAGAPRRRRRSRRR